jgi:acyl-CoA thioesterase
MSDSSTLDTKHLSAQDLASRASQAMHANDASAEALGIEILQVHPGRASVAFTVQPHMLNGHDICHGGYIFLLADSAMAHASNSHNRNAVASAAGIDWLRPAKRGARLVARAEEQTLSGRTGIYDVRITNDGDELIAIFRGKTRQIKGELVDNLEIGDD